MPSGRQCSGDGGGGLGLPPKGCWVRPIDGHGGGGTGWRLGGGRRRVQGPGGVSIAHIGRRSALVMRAGNQ